MQKKILITAGPVGGHLDPNKFVTNKSRGIWAIEFAKFLARKGHNVTLLASKEIPSGRIPLYDDVAGLSIITCDGYADYAQKCERGALQCDTVILAAAVVNWLPCDPYPLESKMPTHGHEPGDVIQVPFMLMPRVIERMKLINPRMTLIGCKLLSGVSEEELIEAAYSQVLIPSKCNLVLANDLTNLKRKILVHQDRTCITFDNDFEPLFQHMLDVIEDIHYYTALCPVAPVFMKGAPNDLFDQIVSKYQDRFVPRGSNTDRVFGSLYVPPAPKSLSVGLCSPREKNSMFSAKDASVLCNVDEVEHTLYVAGRNRVSLNAPLLIRVAEKFPEAVAVLHLHEQLPNVPTVPYAPPGTVRDNNRDIPGPVFNIEGHGFIACLDKDLEIFK